MNQTPLTDYKQSPRRMNDIQHRREEGVNVGKDAHEVHRAPHQQEKKGDDDDE